MNWARPLPPPRPVVGSLTIPPEKPRYVGALPDWALCWSRYMKPVLRVCLPRILVTLSMIVKASVAEVLLIQGVGPKLREPPGVLIGNQGAGDAVPMRILRVVS